LIAGGVAANLHGSVRATKDVDVLVPRDARNAQRLLKALSSLPYRIAEELDADEIIRKPITIIGDDPRVDVLTVAYSVPFEAAWPRRRTRRIDGTRIPYLGLEDLIRSKRTGRPSDAADIDVLSGLGERSRRKESRPKNTARRER
jgi:hypothetical protein